MEQTRDLARRRSRGPGGSNAAVRRGEAVPGPLPVDVPGRRGDRADGGGQEGQRDLRHGPGHAQALLPRLLRRGEQHPPVGRCLQLRVLETRGRLS